uniref:Si:ch211-269k10.5 n=1 Tax=Oncorhynchus mykiss TaxID=8022 RepID=A0A8C7RQ80_ONCMY
MKYTFQSDECMVITIPLGSLRNAPEGQLMPENFHCVFKDVYKVFLKGQPKALGEQKKHLCFIKFVAAGMLTYAAGHSPSMCVTKLSFSLNIVSCFWTVAAKKSCVLSVLSYYSLCQVFSGIKWIIVVPLVIELVVAMVAIYWESKAVCRQHFNILVRLCLLY